MKKESQVFVLISDDSDLHLQLDKESFLSGRPFNEGAFGFVWAGVRTNCGVSDGKVQITLYLFA